MKYLTSILRSGYSPEPETPSKAGVLMEVLAYYVGRIPIPGICLDHQATGQYFDTKLIKATKPMHGKISKTSGEDHILYKQISKEHDLVRSPSLLITRVNTPLQVVAKTANSEAMAVAHRKMSI